MKIEGIYHTKKYTALILSERLPFIPYSKIRINGIDYVPEIVYDVPNEIGILREDGDDSLVGHTVEFIR